MDVVFFPTPDDFRAWLEANHQSAQELWVGYYKKDSGRPSISWPESVDQALCFGWIDGIRKRIDDESYKIRFTPRKPSSIWSAVNIARVAELTELGLMQPAGVAAFEKRKEDKSAIYTYEQRDSVSLPEDYERQLKANEAAWAYFQARPPSYQKAALHWVMSAKKEETRLKRLATLIDDSQHGRFIPPFKFSKDNPQR